eukprot:1324068-Rhodomonas_salina.2
MNCIYCLHNGRLLPRRGTILQIRAFSKISTVSSNLPRYRKKFGVVAPSVRLTLHRALDLLLYWSTRFVGPVPGYPGYRSESVVADVAIVHPFTGKSRRREDWGTYKPRVVKDKQSAKGRLYFAFHRDQNMLFIPLVGTTFGRLDADSLVLSRELARRASDHHFLSRGWNPVNPLTGKPTSAYLSHLSRTVQRFLSRLSLALCRAAGSRGLPANAPHYQPDHDTAEAETAPPRG